MVSTLDHLNDAIRNNEYIPTIFEWPGFILDFVVADFMHCVCLGVVQFVLGNVLWELFLLCNGIQCNPNEALSQLMVCIRLASKQLGAKVPLNNLTLGMFKRDQKTPKLMVKAAEGRRMVPVVLKVLELFFPPRSERDHLRYNVVEWPKR